MTSGVEISNGMKVKSETFLSTRVTLMLQCGNKSPRIPTSNEIKEIHIKSDFLLLFYVTDFGKYLKFIKL